MSNNWEGSRAERATETVSTGALHMTGAWWSIALLGGSVIATIVIGWLVFDWMTSEPPAPPPELMVTQSCYSRWQGKITGYLAKDATGQLWHLTTKNQRTKVATGSDLREICRSKRW